MHHDMAAKVEAEVNKLVNVGSIREVQYLIWLANIVPVKKKNGKIGFASISGIRTNLVPKITSSTAYRVTCRCGDRLRGIIIS